MTTRELRRTYIDKMIADVTNRGGDLNFAINTSTAMALRLKRKELLEYLGRCLVDSDEEN